MGMNIDMEFDFDYEILNEFKKWANRRLIDA